MKVGLVRRGHSPTGGAEAYLIRLGSALVALGHVPVLVTTADWPDSRWVNGQIVRLDGRTPEEFAAAFRAAKTGCDIHLGLERVPGCEVYRAGDGVHAAWLARRAAFGIARSGGIASNESGDLILAFSTANTAAVETHEGLVEARYLGEQAMSRFYEATIQAVDEAIMNSIFANETMVGRDGYVCPGLPIERVQAILRRHGRLVEVD